MTMRFMRGAAVSAALLAGGCQTGVYESRPMPSTTAMDGVWASTDGVFVASFDRGTFTSRFTATNEILAQGSYSVAGGAVSMQWVSVATQQRRAASCSFRAADVVTCDQQGGGHFELRRGAVPPVAAVPPGMAIPPGDPALPPAVPN
jgi:hypothetical protein